MNPCGFYTYPPERIIIHKKKFEFYQYLCAILISYHIPLRKSLKNKKIDSYNNCAHYCAQTAQGSAQTNKLCAQLVDAINIYKFVNYYNNILNIKHLDNLICYLCKNNHHQIIIRMKEPLVTYIRIRELFHPFLMFSYGDLPIDLPDTDELYDIFTTGLIPNYSMKRICYSTFSKAAYDKGIGNQQVALFCEEPSKIFVPNEKDKQKLVPFVMPRTIIFGGKVKKTDQWFQLGNSAYRIFSEQIEKNFWNAFERFDNKVLLYCGRENLKYSIEMSIEKFMKKVGMDMDDFDTFARYWRDERKKRDENISKYSNKEPTANLREQLDYEIITKQENFDSVYNR